MGLAAACSSSLPDRTLELDCSINDSYVFNVVQPLEIAVPPTGVLTPTDAAMHQWFQFGDMTPGAERVLELRPIPDGRCDSAVALVIGAKGHADWGAGFGEYGTATAIAGVDASTFDGVSFWARAAGYGTSTGFLVTVSDRNSFAREPVVGEEDLPPAPGAPVCTVPAADDTAEGYVVNAAGVLVPFGGDLPAPDDCGNGFQRVVTAQREWFLHRLPFESFTQEALPNRKPGGIDRSGIFQFTFNIPKDSVIELWIDDLGFYREISGSDPAATGSSEL
jgi:hypothetical protein